MASISLQSRCVIFSLIASIVCLSSNLVVAQQDDAAPPVISQLLQDRNYTRAVAAIDALLKDSPKTPDYLLYLRGRALHFQAKYDEAISAFDELAKRHPESNWARKARLAKGLANARKGDFQAAEKIYRSEATFLLSSERKQEIAIIYREYADAFFQPEGETKKPDYAKAFGFYAKAKSIAPDAKDRLDIDLRMARCQQLLGKHADAAKLYETFLNDHGEHEKALEARFRLGEALQAAGRSVDARRSWRKLLQADKQNKSPRTAEAAFQLALTYKIPNPPSDEEMSLGIRALESFIARFPTHEKVSTAHLRIAQTYHNSRRFDEAVKRFQVYLAEPKFEADKETATARYLLAHAYKMQGRFEDAEKSWEMFLSKHPTHQLWNDAQREIIDTQFVRAQKQYVQQKYADARKLWTLFQAQHPLDPRNIDVMYRFGEMHFASKNWKPAIADWRRLVVKHPQTAQASKAQLMIARTLEQQLGSLPESLAEYRKLTWGPHVSDAKTAIKRLTTKSMSVATERIFRSNETPHLKLSTRNIEQVKVSVYSLDLETYFRKMHLADGIERLDIALIDPDNSFDFKTPKYQQYAEIKSDLGTPLSVMAGAKDGKEKKDKEKKDKNDNAKEDNAERKAGVMAVTVSSETLEATSLVVQSDLDIIVKCSRNEVFVFAENMRTGKPWSKARILISDGRKIFLEGETGADGVFRSTDKHLRAAQDVRVFAISGSHTASNMTSLQGVGVAGGLATKGYIYTERPTYRPGQMVHVRGVIRAVQGDSYQAVENKEYRVDVYDSRSRRLFRRQVKLNKYGAFHTQILLPPDCPQGDYRIQVLDDLKDRFQGAFHVREFVTPTVELEIEAERSIYYRGELIEGKILARYRYGAPLAGRTIRYRAAGGPMKTATCDSEGRVAFSIETLDLKTNASTRESQIITLQAELPELGLRANRLFYLAPRGYAISASTVRPTFLNGETFEVTVKAVDPAGQPVEREMSLDVVEQIAIGAESGEHIVNTYKLKTDATGAARRTLKLNKGGNYLLRFDGRDRFGNLVSTETRVQISADDDLRRLRILANRHSFRVGDMAAINIHWREKPALALLTYEGAEILGYQLLTLDKGSNRLQLPMTAKLAPNFRLSIAVMIDSADNAKAPTKRFHQVDSPFEVDRGLEVAIELPKDEKGKTISAKPGETLQLKIKTTDRNGKPAPAELGLAMVESSLSKRWKPLAPPISAFFKGRRRTFTLRTLSSIDFTYEPATTPISASLLAESARVQLANTERQRLAKLRQSGAFAGGGMGGGGFGGGSFPGFRANNGNANRPGNDPFGGQSVNGRAGQTGGAAQQVQMSTLGQNEFAGKLAGISVANFDPPPANVATDIATLDSAGVWSYRTLSRESFEPRERMAALVALRNELARENARLLADLPQHETGYWNPSIITDAKGQATVEIRLPQRSTEWKLTAEGISQDTLTGSAEQKFRVSKDLFGQLNLPTAFYAGDTAAIVASIHNQAIKKGQIEVELRITVGAKSSLIKRQVEVAKTGVTQLEFEHQFVLPADQAARLGEPGALATFELSLASGDHRDSIRRAIPLRVDGLPSFSLASGSASGDASATVAAIPGGAPLSAPRMQIIIGPTIEQSLYDAVLSPPIWCQNHWGRVASPLDHTVSELMAALALREWSKKAANKDDPRNTELDEKIRNAVDALAAYQNSDGGWSWADRRNISDHFATSRVVWAMSLAKRAAYDPGVDVLPGAVKFLKSQLSKVRVNDYETKAVLLHALAEADAGDFPLVNQLFRNRQSLGVSGLAYLSLACSAMDRKPTALELLTLLKQRDLGKLSTETMPAGGSQVELRALYAVALEAAGGNDEVLAEQVKWLMSHRTGYRWSPVRATGPAVLALSRWFSRGELQGENYQLKIIVNDKPAKTIDVAKGAGSQIIDVPDALLADGEQRVRFELKGRGRYAYQCVLGGYVASDKIKSSTKRWTVERIYEPAVRELDGVAIPRGFRSIGGKVQSFRNSLHNLPRGQRGVVELQVTRFKTEAGPAKLEYLVITEPLPAGASLVENSVRGGFERYEVSPGEITFFVGDAAGPKPIRFEIYGSLEGKFSTPPTVARNAYRPDQFAIADSLKLTVLDKEQASPDPYRLSPDELLEIGKRRFARKEFKEARAHLSELFANWTLKSNVYQQTVKMLLDIHLETGPSKEVVRYFEIIIEKYPKLPLRFEDYLKIADAYDAIQEYERSYLVFRATLEKSFLRESFVAGSLEEQGDFLRSVEFLSKLLLDYPPEPYAAAARYALAQRVYAKAPKAAEDEQLKLKGVSRIDLVERSLQMLDTFLAHYPDDPAADKAAFSYASALLELDAYPAAIIACERFAKRYPKSDFLDSYWYVIGFCQFAEGEHQAALEMCRKVSLSETVDSDSGTRRESRNKYRAIYILGQIHHSLGQPKEAIREYERVKDRYVDAQQAIDYFSRKAIELPEITPVKPGDVATVELKHRNVSACEVTVYRIDLLKFSLLRRNLGGISNINLAGIRAHHQQSIDLGDGKDYRDRSTKVDFPLKQQGAYLVVCRGDDLHSSGLVLVSDLKLEVQEDAKSGRVRATVRELDNNKYVRDVHVKIIGSLNSEFSAGETDLRGVFVADQIHGRSTVIARADAARYAFYRGKQDLGPRQPTAPGQFGKPSAKSKKTAGAKTSGKDALLEGLMEGAKSLQDEQEKELDQLYKGLQDDKPGGQGGFGGGFGGGGIF